MIVLGHGVVAHMHYVLVGGMFFPLVADCTTGCRTCPIWFWHAPRPYMLALEHPWWHAFEHAVFC